MTQPTEYDRQASFSNIQAQAPDDPLPGNTLDAELNAIKVTLDEILANLAKIQRDDGALANESVGTDQLSTELSVGINTWSVWTTATDYAVNDTVFRTSAVYRCLTAHTSGTFSTDLAAAKWELIIDLATLTLATAANIANVPAGSIVATTVQAAIDELASEKAAASHTHPSSAITDSTAAGRAILAAATAAAQRTLLGLGALALEDTVPITEIDAQLALTGVISPTALASNTNNWAPTGWATSTRVRFSCSSAIDITGLLATSDGDIKILDNIGSTYAATLKNASASSAIANRITAGADISIGPGTSAILVYDGTSTQWRVVSFSRIIASTAQAQALSDDTVSMTPAKTSSAIAAYIAANPATANPYGLQLFHIQDQKANNTDGGTFTNGAWRTRDLNTVVTNQITGASLAANQITLPAGTYDFEARAPARGVILHKAKLRNITDNTDTLIGSSEETNNAVGYTTVSFVRGRFTIAATKVFELQHYSSATGTFGSASNFSVIEVYSDVAIRKVA